MPKKPSDFSRYYRPIMSFGDVDLNYIPIDRYVSGSPWNKKWPKKAIADMYHFVRRTAQYKDKNYTRHHELYGNGFFGSFLSEPKFVPLTWGELQLCYYGKGSPEQFGNALRIIDYYLTVADMSLSYLGWSSRMNLVDYAYYYLGLDCNGFAGAYYRAVFPHVGIDGNYHINDLHKRTSVLAERKSVAEVRVGDLIVRRGSSGGGKRHVALVDAVLSTSGKSAQLIVTQSASSLGGLNSSQYTLQAIDPPESDGYGALKWSLVGYHKFNFVLGPKTT